MSKKLLFSALALLFLFAAIFSGLLMLRKDQEYRTQAYAATIDINTSQNQFQNIIHTTELHLKFNPNIIQILDIQPGNFFEQPQITGPLIQNAGGLASITLVRHSNSPPPPPSGQLAVLTLKTLTPGVGSLEFTSSTTTLNPQGLNVLDTTTPLVLTVNP